MEIKVYNSLSDQPAKLEIRWPGAERLKDWPARDKFAVMHVQLNEETARESVEAYSRFLEGRKVHAPDEIDMRTVDGGEVVSRFFLSRLLLREWTKLLHNNRANIILSDQPKAKSRVRSYKGLTSPECRAKAILFDQYEIEIGPQISVLLNKVEVDSSAPAACFIPLGDTFGAFGVYGWLESASGSTLLTHIASCYGKQRHIWQWELSRMLPVICADSASMFFLQGVANETDLQIIVYLPLEQLEKHLEVARTRFCAEISVAS